MDDRLTFTPREIKEIEHALVYLTKWSHGTVGHNMLLIIANFAQYAGFYLDKNLSLVVPDNVRVNEEAKR